MSQLLQREPDAWTAVLRRQLGDDDLQVTAVAAEHIYADATRRYHAHITRFTLTLAGYSDPITCIGKRTNAIEASFYRDVASLHPLAPTCWYAHVTGDDSWVVLDDVPAQIPPHRWSPEHVQDLVHHLAELHAPTWNRPAALRQIDWLPRFFDRQRSRYTWERLRREHELLFSEGPGSIISEHAIVQAGRLAPLFLQAANGLAVMRSLGGWPGLLGESHLAAAGELLDDPVPMLDRLQDLPPTLLHGRVHNYHWRVTLFEEHRLLDWQHACVGPGAWDLISFVENFDLLYRPQLPWLVSSRQESPATEETIVDTYMLAMRARLGAEFDARAVRLALPAARCLYVLVTWFPHFANWFAEMPNTYTWQKVNRLQDQELVGTRFEAIIGYRAHLRGTFQRFLQSFRNL